ncbi:hypothetical protein ACXYTP_21455 [Tsukamurella ocularis]
MSGNAWESNIVYALGRHGLRAIPLGNKQFAVGLNVAAANDLAHLIEQGLPPSWTPQAVGHVGILALMAGDWRLTLGFERVVSISAFDQIADYLN